jgi:hypothetical protein
MLHHYLLKARLQKEGEHHVSHRMKKRIILISKLIGSGIVLWVSWVFAVGGRSMGPGFHFFHNIHPALYFSLVIVPTLLCLAFWGRRRGAIVSCLAVVLILLAAHIACLIEEHIFIKEHETTGAGPHPRHFDSSSWLAYDAETKELSGAD